MIRKIQLLLVHPVLLALLLVNDTPPLTDPSCDLSTSVSPWGKDCVWDTLWLVIKFQGSRKEGREGDFSITGF